MAAAKQLRKGTIVEAFAVNVIRVGPDYDHASILRLIQREFTGMEGRINPPSSMHRLTTDGIARHAKDADVLVIEKSGIAIACLFGTPNNNAYYLGKTTVSKGFRRQGLARKLVETSIPIAISAGASKLELRVRIELTENHAAFAKMGFVKTGETAHEGFKTMTSITMHRPIDEKD